MRGRMIAAGVTVIGTLLSAAPAYAQANGTQPAGGAARRDSDGLRLAGARAAEPRRALDAR